MRCGYDNLRIQASGTCTHGVVAKRLQCMCLVMHTYRAYAYRADDAGNSVHRGMGRKGALCGQSCCEARRTPDAVWGVGYV